MPGEGAMQSLLQKLAEEFEKIRGKDEQALIDAWEANRDVFDQLPEEFQTRIRKNYAATKTLIAYGWKPEAEYVNSFIESLKDFADNVSAAVKQVREPPSKGVTQQGSTRPYRKKFDRCVKSVRKTVKARKGSTKESAAIAICTKSVLRTRGRTMKKYKKGHLTTQKYE